MVKAPGSEKPSLRKGSWAPEEDRKLIAYIRRYGIWNWSEMPKYAGIYIYKHKYLGTTKEEKKKKRKTKGENLNNFYLGMREYMNN